MSETNYDIAHSQALNRNPEASTAWLRKRKENLSKAGSVMNFNALRQVLDSPDFQLSLHEFTEALLDRGDIEAVLRDRLEAEGWADDVELQNLIEPITEQLCKVMASCAMETAYILNLQISEFSVGVADTSQDPISHEAYALDHGNFVQIKLSHEEIWRSFTSYVQLLTGRTLRVDLQPIDLAQIPSSIAHEMYHVRQSIHDVEYSRETGQANAQRLPPRSMSEFPNREDWAKYSDERSRRERLYLLNIGELAARKFQRLYVIFLLKRLEELPQDEFLTQLKQGYVAELNYLRSEIKNVRRERETLTE